MTVTFTTRLVIAAENINTREKNTSGDIPGDLFEGYRFVSCTERSRNLYRWISLYPAHP